ncbi:MAG: GNAT family N-acetyltransferase [Hyphomicrobiales bacterium]|nr:MAG: GNAT family N-acetyltransferase [Hyphomicrobiales bacterium]
MVDCTIRFVTASANDRDELADLRVEVMRPSLEAVGRFDMVRARQWFLDTFDPNDTRKIERDGQLIGFYTVKEFDDHLYLDNLYLRAAERGQGIGSMIVGSVKEQARQQSLPIRLAALTGSDANAFYLGHGFKLIRASEFDNYYEFITG